MGFFSAVKRFFTGKTLTEKENIQSESKEVKKTQQIDNKKEEAVLINKPELDTESSLEEEGELLSSLQSCEPKLSVWLSIILKHVDKADSLLWKRLSFLLQVLETPKNEADKFINEFQVWLKKMDYYWLEDFRSELQYRLALALELEDEEDERDRLFVKLRSGLEKTRSQFSKGLFALISSHSELDQVFWDNMEELFIMSDIGFETSSYLLKNIKNKAAEKHITKTEEIKPIIAQELVNIFNLPKKITTISNPEIVLMVGVNGVGKTTTIAKLAFRSKSQGKKVLIVAADTFRAAAVEQLQVWAERLDVSFYSKHAGADPAAVAFEAMDIALTGKYDVVYIDTAGRLHTKSNLMDELHKIRTVVSKKLAHAPQRTILVIDATTGQNALQQTKIFKESSGVTEIILTKLDGTAKGGVAISVVHHFNLPITFIGLGEKMEDLRPFNAEDYAQALLAE